jgi:hypothetical protein
MAGKTKSRRGGFLGSLINQAIVPFGILGMQQTYRRKRRGGKKTRKYGGKRRSSRRH